MATSTRTATRDGYTVTEGYQPRPASQPLQKGHRALTTSRPSTPKPPKGGSSALKPASRK